MNNLGEMTVSTKTMIKFMLNAEAIYRRTGIYKITTQSFLGELIDEAPATTCGFVLPQQVLLK